MERVYSYNLGERIRESWHKMRCGRYLEYFGGVHDESFVLQVAEGRRAADEWRRLPASSDAVRYGGGCVGGRRCRWRTQHSRQRRTERRGRRRLNAYPGLEAGPGHRMKSRVEDPQVDGVLRRWLWLLRMVVVLVMKLRHYQVHWG